MIKFFYDQGVNLGGSGIVNAGGLWGGRGFHGVRGGGGFHGARGGRIRGTECHGLGASQVPTVWP